MRRKEIDIIADILEAAKCPGTNKTAIVYRTNLNFNVAGKYLIKLMESGLIYEENNGNRYYKTTDKGKDFLSKVREVNSVLNGR